MSCQAPRTSDDPYIFTETPVSTPIFSSQFGRIAPIKSNQQHLPKQQLQFIRTNGQHNGINNSLNSINYPKTINQQQKILTKKISAPPPLVIAPQQLQQHLQQQQQQHQPTQINYLKPPPPLYHNNTKLLVNQKLNNHSVSFFTTTASSQNIKTLNNHQQQQQQNQLKQQQQPQIRTVAQKPVYEHITGSYPQNLPPPLAPPLKIKCENLKLADDGSNDKFIATSNSCSSSSNGSAFTVPKAAAVKKIVQSKTSFPAGPRTKRTYSQTSHHEALQRISSRLSNTSVATSNNEWHAPDSFIFDYTGPGAVKTDILELAPSTQSHWFLNTKRKYDNNVEREKNLEIKRANLRRQAIQYSNSQKLRSNIGSKRRLMAVSKILSEIKAKEEPLPSKKCCISACTNDALALTAYCYLHIICNTDQKLFHPCTAKFSDNSQCRVPVFDISHELPLCREHAWKRDNYNKMLQEQKPKKPPRKKPKPSAMTRPPKRNKKKRKAPPKQQVQQQKQQILQQQQQEQQQLQHDSMELLNNHNLDLSPILPQNNYHNHQIMLTSGVESHTQEFINVCENSSAYESSEDTGVGGLSESELIGVHDVIEEIPLSEARLLEEHDLTNVLNQLPEDFNEFFAVSVHQNGPFEPTQEEQEDLERELAIVDEQVKSLEQMTGSGSDFLDDFLDGQMLEDSNMCSDVLQSGSTTSEIRGLVHT